MKRIAAFALAALLLCAVGCGLRAGNEKKQQTEEKGDWRVTKSVTYDSDGSVNARHEYEYDANGNCVRETHYNADGSAEGWVEYEWTYFENATKTGNVSRGRFS